MHHVVSLTEFSFGGGGTEGEQREAIYSVPLLIVLAR